MHRRIESGSTMSVIKPESKKRRRSSTKWKNVFTNLVVIEQSPVMKKHNLSNWGKYRLDKQLGKLQGKLPDFISSTVCISRREKSSK